MLFESFRFRVGGFSPDHLILMGRAGCSVIDTFA